MVLLEKEKILHLFMKVSDFVEDVFDLLNAIFFRREKQNIKTTAQMQEAQRTKNVVRACLVCRDEVRFSWELTLLIKTGQF